MSLLGAATIAQGALGLGKGIFGLFQAAKASRQLRNLEQPMYSTPESLTQMGNLARQMASSTELPGQRQYEDKLGQTQSEGVYNAMKFAKDSAAGQATAERLAQTKMQAIQDLGGMFAEYKYKNQQGLMNVMGQEAEDQRTKFQVNQYQPYMIKMNELTGQRQAGIDNLFGGVDSALSSAANFAGTNEYLNVLKSMQPK
jgi:ABC-type multidrug transport system permease subunit